MEDETLLDFIGGKSLKKEELERKMEGGGVRKQKRKRFFKIRKHRSKLTQKGQKWKKTYG